MRFSGKTKQKFHIYIAYNSVFVYLCRKYNHKTKMKRVYLAIVAAIAALSFTSCSQHEITIDQNIPAGNIVFERISNDTVYVHQDLRGSKKPWFYWAFRVKGAEGKRLTFVFTQTYAVSPRGPLVSLDRGKNYEYLAEEGSTDFQFTYTFPKRAKEVWFYECHPYTPEMWEAFLKRPHKGKFETGILCKSPKGREVPFFRMTPQNQKPKLSVVISGRHHCSESSVMYVAEGLIATFLEDGELGEWLRENIELTAVPFVDMDGAVEGDQGKWRTPHDHNRDYTEFLYPETAALASLIAETEPDIYLDFHNPGLRKKHNYVYTPHKAEMHPIEPAFSLLLEKYQEGNFGYTVADDMPFGVGWNTAKNYTDGLSAANWVNINIKSIKVSRTIEIPFTFAKETRVYPSNMREFGHGIARTLKAFAEGEADEILKQLQSEK